MPSNTSSDQTRSLGRSQRGGRHEVLLEQLCETFHVRALDPICADDLRARVETGKDWHPAEWRRERSGLQQHDLQSKRHPSKSVCGSPADSLNATRMGVVGKVDSPPTVSQQSHCSPEHGHALCEAASVATEVPGATDGLDMGAKGGNGGFTNEGCTKGGCSSVTTSGGADEGVWRRDWGYEARGLGTILSFVARRRDE